MRQGHQSTVWVNHPAPASEYTYVLWMAFSSADRCSTAVVPGPLVQHHPCSWAGPPLFPLFSPCQPLLDFLMPHSKKALSTLPAHTSSAMTYADNGKYTGSNNGSAANAWVLSAAVGGTSAFAPCLPLPVSLTNPLLRVQSFHHPMHNSVQP